MSCLTKIIKNSKQNLKNLNIGIFISTIIFGISSWVVFSGILIEAPLLTQKLPEGWKLSSNINFASQFGQIGPILLFLMKCKCLSAFNNSCSRRARRHTVSDRLIIYGLFTIGLIGSCCISLFWDKTYFIFGQERSLALFLCVFALSILDCTCTIVFLTYIGKFKANYITALYIGEGISSLLPSFFALIQGIGDDESMPDIDCINNASSYNLSINKNEKSNLNIKQPRFSISVYFTLLTATIIVSLIAFLFLDFFPSFQKEKIRKRISRELKVFRNYEEVCTNENSDAHILQKRKALRRNKNLDEFFLLLAITIVSFILYGFLPGLFSYSALPYGYDIMHLSIILANISLPVSSLIGTFIQIKSTKQIWIFLLISIILSSYLSVSAYLSPCPPFLDYFFGGYLMVAVWTLTFSFFMLLRCFITLALENNHGEKTLIWCGLLTQLGQLLGSILSNILIEVFKDHCNLNFSCKN